MPPPQFDAALLLVLVLAYWERHLSRTPANTSILTGARYVGELMVGSDQRFFDVTRLSKSCFMLLVWELKLHTKQRGLQADEIVMIGLRILATGMSVREIADRFQHSTSTISRAFKLFINQCLILYSPYVSAPDPVRVPLEILSNPKFYPFFKNCIGAIDGSHIPCQVDANEVARYRNRKGFVSMNVLAVCNFDLTFSYLWPGWEGSAHDGRVLAHARADGGFAIPDGKYYLADAGYGLSSKFLVPYRSTRYHLREQIIAGMHGTRPETKEELFNLRHAQLRNAIERIFGVVKKRFRILLAASEYSVHVLQEINYACALLHNFIKENGSLQDGVYENDLHQTIQREGPERIIEAPGDGAQGGEAWCTRDRIARRMWRQYQETLERS